MQRLFLLGIMLGIFNHSVYAGENVAANQLTQRLNALHTMSAQFNQEILSKKHVISHSSGTMGIQRPGKFRWDTKSPMAQRVIADGKHIWIYDVDLEQVTVKKQSKGLGGTPGLFLSGYDNTVARDFSVSMSQKGGLELYDLMPKSRKDSFQHVQLGFKGNALYSIDLYDQLGQHTKVKLYNIKVNPHLPGKMFSFSPPKGTDVVHQ